MTSQYVPSGSEVENVAVQAESALLIATKPRAPKMRTGVSRRRCERQGRIRTAAKRNLLRLRGDPVGERRAANVVPEADHARDGGPAVLAEPPVRAAAARARANTAVGRARVGVGEAAVAREDGDGAVGVSEREDHGGRVGVRARVGVEGGAVLRGGGLDPFGR